MYGDVGGAAGPVDLVAAVAHQTAAEPDNPDVFVAERHKSFAVSGVGQRKAPFPRPTAKARVRSCVPDLIAAET